jgi:hypothetical protein
MKTDTDTNGAYIVSKKGIVVFREDRGKFTDDMGEHLIYLVGMGKTQVEICNEVGITSVTLCAWKNEKSPYYKKEFAEQYKIAYKDGADVISAECKEIADNSEGDVYDDVNSKGVTVSRPNNANVQRDKLRIETRRWMCAIRNKEKYGKLDVSKDISNVETTFIINQFGDGKKNGDSASAIKSVKAAVINRLEDKG